MAGKRSRRMEKPQAYARAVVGSGEFGRLEIYILILLGAVGLLAALNMFNFGAMGMLFQLTWSVLVLVIGLSRLMKY